MKVLVIGGTGTIGLGIVEECIKRGYETYTISRGNNDNRLPKECKVLKGDIKDVNGMKEILKDRKFDVIFDGLVFRIPNLKRSINIYSGKCKHYIFVSTTGIYARELDEKIITENSKKGRTEWEYNRGKIACEKYLLKNKGKLPFEVTIVRPSVTYGDRRIPYTIVCRKKQWSLVERIEDNKPVIGGPNVEYSICHLEDFSTAVVSLFLNNKAYDKAFHIGGRDIIKWDDVILKLGEYINKKPKIIHIDIELLKIFYPELYLEIKYNKSDSLILSNKSISEAVEDFNLKIGLDDGLKRTFNTLRKEQREMPYEESWNKTIDLLIYIMYKNNKLNAEEKEIAKNYLEKINIEELDKEYKIRKKNYPKFLIKNKLKEIAHRFI